MLKPANNSILADVLVTTQSDSSNSASLGLHRLLLLRGFVTVASIFGLMIFRFFSSLELPLTFISYLVVIIILSILAGLWRLKSSWIVSNAELFSHLLMDVTFLVILLLNTGGASNPLISYLLVLLAVTATLLPPRFVYSFAVGSIFIYTSFLLLDLNRNQGLGADSDTGMAAEQVTFQLHLIGMWVIFLVSAILISVFITRMATAIQVRETNLAQARETALRNEQLVAIGTLAAGTAHALGTPLSTMAVLLNELDKQDAEELKQGDIKEDISLLRQQVTRCKHSLTQLIRYYNKDNPEEEETIELESFVSDIKDYIVNIHPAATVNFTIEGDANSNIASNLSLKHAVINIIENGIKAAESAVAVAFKIIWTNPAHFEISINDDGPGIPARVMENMGEPFISTHKESMGLGIFLANASIKRLGGSIEMFNLKAGGALTLIKLPLPEY